MSKRIVTLYCLLSLLISCGKPASGQTDVTPETEPEAPGGQDMSAFLATNQYIETFLEEVNYPNTNKYDTDKEYGYSLVKRYPGGGPSENNCELPPTYTIEWTATAADGALKLQVWEGSWSREYNLPAGTTSQGITNLVPCRTYGYKVTGTGDALVAEGSFKTRGMLHQIYFEPNVRNGRDLGGWKGLNGKTVAYRKLFRGGVLQDGAKYFNNAGKAEMRAQGIKAELDLQEEGVAQSSSPLGSDIAFFAPHFASGWNEMVARNTDKVKECFCWIVDRLREDKPVYFHCWAGRDRTGTLAVLLLGTLGVSESDMAKDFELTYFSPKSWSMYEDAYQHTRDNGNYKSLRKTIYEKTVSGTYQDRIVKYLIQIGVPEKDIQDFREIMLE